MCRINEFMNLLLRFVLAFSGKELKSIAFIIAHLWRTIGLQVLHK